ncbi:uncharacterized protein LOC125179567 [Hyalella azteca]|uniref:Uncharacterized protein LOC125179567 n=1 Tax=Hyalella azteca TaxID=294128 RepID=A0A979FWH7_HYAAZ|nr:uncharacterized protein LOC125179567 [Hyalella azteca]
MTSGPITLPAIRHREKKAPVKKEPVAMDLEAIRLRRERLAALTTAKRTGGAADLSAARTRPPAAPSSASKIRKKHHGDPQPDSGKSKKTVRLMPIGNRRSDPQGNELDRQRAADPLLKKPSLKKPESKKASPKTNSKENKPVKKVSIQAKKKPPKAVIDRKEFITPAIHDMRAFSDDRRFDYREPAEYYDPKPYDDLPEEELVLPSYPLEEPAEEVEVPGEEPEPEEEPLKEQEEQAKVEPPNVEEEDDDPELKMKLERRTAMRLLNSLEEKDQLEGATTARRHLSVSVDPPIAEYINANAVPLLISLLNKHHNPQLQFEALWALTNIASGSSDQTRTVVEAGGLPPIARLLSSADPEIVDQAVWAIGNIAGDGPAMRDAVLRVRIVQLLDDAKKKLSSVSHGEN